MRVVEVAEHTLQVLQGTENTIEIGWVVEAGHDIDQVAQLLGGDPDLVQPRGRGAIVDRPGLVSDSPTQAPGAAGHHVRE